MINQKHTRRALSHSYLNIFLRLRIVQYVDYRKNCWATGFKILS